MTRGWLPTPGFFWRMTVFSRWRRKKEGTTSSAQSVYDKAALDQLFGKIPFLNGVLGDISASETARVRDMIAQKRAWVQTLEDHRWRSAFGRWLDHAEYFCRKADNYREERPAKNARWEAQDAERRIAVEAARQLMQTNPPR
jgi:hypothetical protein